MNVYSGTLWEVVAKGDSTVILYVSGCYSMLNVLFVMQVNSFRNIKIK